MRPYLTASLIAFCTFLIVGATPAPVDIATLPRASSSSLQSFYDRFVYFEGTVSDIFADELDKDYWYLTVTDDSGNIYAAIKTQDSEFHPQDYLGATIAFYGRCQPTHMLRNRRYMRHVITIRNPSDVRVLSRPLDAPFNAPPLKDLNVSKLSPSDVIQMGRVRTTGTILAIRQKHEALLRDEDERIMRLEFIENAPPTCGMTVEVVGQLETDISHLNLSRCSWRKAQAPLKPTTTVQTVSLRDIIRPLQDRTIYKMDFHGKTICLNGTVKSLPESSENSPIIYLESEGITIPVDISQLGARPRDLEVGCRISVTGVCWMELDNWRASSIFPQTRGLAIFPSRADNLRVISAAPRWTPKRLLVIITILIGLLLTAGLWITILHRLSERRGRALFKEQIGHVAAELRVNERTRLAVEIHDSISQNLTGVALEINSGHYETAQRMLKSCRNELRNCLWDLRNDTLGVSSMDAAIRLTLSPHLRSTVCLIDFPVPRNLFTDSTAHALLKIIRELTVNAIRHGQASEIRVTGGIVGQELHVSVQDNGCGFDPHTAPGLNEGHFGLQGVLERIAEFDGVLEIKSHQGVGTTVSFAINIGNKQEISA